MVTVPIMIPSRAFFGDDTVEASLCEIWDINVCHMKGNGLPGKSDEEIRNRLRNPIGGRPLRSLAEGKKRICIAFDDLTRPTPAHRVVPFILDELHKGGVHDNQIRFVAALGAHRAMTWPEVAAKLGWGVVEKYPIYMHNIYENLVYLGRTSNGTPVHVNREFMSCDLKISIGGLLPHAWTGFSGGGKIVMPGLSGVETIKAHHQKLCVAQIPGSVDLNEARLDLEEAARLAGIDFVVDVVMNERREVVGLFAGDVAEEYRTAAKFARSVYATELAQDMDVLVLNTYPCECKMDRSLWPIPLCLRDGGDVVLIATGPMGQGLHYLLGRHGTDYGGQMFEPRPGFPPLSRVGRCVVWAPHVSRFDLRDIGPDEKVLHCRNWSGVLEILEDRHGPGTRVGVFPYASMQFPANRIQM